LNPAYGQVLIPPGRRILDGMAKVRALGVHCTPKGVFLAIVEAGAVLDEDPQRVVVPDGLQTGASLKALSDELHRRLVEARATHAVLLAPTSYDSRINPTVARVGAETLVRATAAALRLEVDLLHRATARSLLKVGQKGELEDVIRELIPKPVGRYWTDGRRFAAFAALACERKVE
jgi:hypothetical protein